LLCSSRDNPASNNWLVQDHIILLDEPDLMASYEGAWARLREILAGGADPRGLHFITGPSGTADIQGQHVTGAHGPQRLHVIYIGHGPDEAG
jgi:L-lactate dehydrogenase complex protein LldG